MIGQLWQSTSSPSSVVISLSSPRWPTRIARVILMNPRFLAFWTSCLRHFPDIRELKKEQKTCLLNLARGKDVFAIMSTGFGKSLIFPLFPRLAKAVLSLENSTIIVVSLLISIIRDQVEQLKKLGFSPAAIGIGEGGGRKGGPKTEKPHRNTLKNRKPHRIFSRISKPRVHAGHNMIADVGKTYDTF